MGSRKIQRNEVISYGKGVEVKPTSYQSEWEKKRKLELIEACTYSDGSKSAVVRIYFN